MTTIPKTLFNPAPPKPGAIVRPSATGALVAERGGGHIVVAQPVWTGSKDMPMVSIGVWWTTPEGHHAPDGRRTCLIHAHELPALILALQALVHEEPIPESMPSKPASPSFQDMALLSLADGFGPHDLPAKLWPGESLNPRRLTELGKAMRRAKLLTPGDWSLTSLGEARAASLERPQGEVKGEAKGDLPDKIPPFPRHDFALAGSY